MKHLFFKTLLLLYFSNIHFKPHERIASRAVIYVVSLSPLKKGLFYVHTLRILSTHSFISHPCIICYIT